MQKRTLYLSLLLASLLLVFSYSFASAQSVTFETKNVARCSDVFINITVNSPVSLSAFELVFTIGGDFTGTPLVTFGTAIDGKLTDRVLQNPVPGYPNTVRMAAMRLDADDVCLPAGPTVVGTIKVHSADLCTGTITVTGATITGTPAAPCNCGLTVATNLVGCDPIVALTTTVTAGTVTIVNQSPTITTCPGPITVPWGTLIQYDVVATDPDNCETLTYSIKDNIPATAHVSPTGHVTWATGGDDVCTHTITVVVTDKCGAFKECATQICVTNQPPVITYDPTEIIEAAWGITITDQIIADDPDGGPHPLFYSMISFNGPTTYGSGFQLDNNTGIWSWAIGNTTPYLGTFTLVVKVTDGANLCDPCSPTNADTATYTIHVSGFTVWIEKVHDQLQGHNTTASIYLDSAFVPAGFTSGLIGGFDFLIAYDASALNFISAEKGALIDNGKFEYFTYRFGPDGNCGNGCPSGMLRVVGLRETNNGVINPNHVAGPGELVKLNFFVSDNRTLECQYVPIRFYWIDCGDNTMSDETGNVLYEGLQVYDFEGNLITDPLEFGYTGPMASCFDTVFKHGVHVPDSVKNFPLGVIIFRNGGIDIICAADIDDRGDINLNSIPNEIGDAVVFTNYFIKGLAAFTVNVEGQIAATDVNADGITLSVADLVYLIRTIVGDVNPYAKPSPGAVASFATTGNTIRVETPVSIGAALFVFDGTVTPTLADDASDMTLKYATENGITRALVYSMEQGRSIRSGNVLTLSGNGTLRTVEAATYDGAILATNKLTVPTEYAINNYPNPFNPTATIELALPNASDWTITIFNVSGQKVADFNGHSNAGLVKVNWDAKGMPSGMYFYKVNAGSFSATKKMVLLK